MAFQAFLVGSAVALAGAEITTKVHTSPGFLVGSVSELILGEAEAPPVFPSRFHVSFSEVSRSVNPFGKGTSSPGSFHYDFEQRRQVWEHGKGQTDNWCQCAGLKTDEPCTLVSARSASEAGGGAIHAVFKTLGKCCKIGDYADGFGPLRPDWLRRSNATFLGKEQVGNRTCSAWAGGPPGDWFMMISDDWSLDEQGRPCTYADHFKWWAKTLLGMKHQLTFDVASYSEEAELDNVFSVPQGIGCDEKCPNTAGGWCKSR